MKIKLNMSMKILVDNNSKHKKVKRVNKNVVLRITHNKHKNDLLNNNKYKTFNE